MQSRVYETVRCPSVCPSVPLSQHAQQQRTATPLLQVCSCGLGKEMISIDCCSRSMQQANVVSAMLSVYNTHTHTHTHPFNGPFSRTTRVGRYQKGKTNLNFTEARDSEWQWHQLGHTQVCTLLQTDNHASTQFFTGRMPSCRPTNSDKALKANQCTTNR